MYTIELRRRAQKSLDKLPDHDFIAVTFTPKQVQLKIQISALFDQRVFDDIAWLLS